MVGFMDPERVYKDVVNKHEPLLCENINPQEMLPYFKEILTQRAAEEITCEQKNYGATATVPKLLSEIKRKRGWFPILIEALLELGHKDIADTLDPNHTVQRPTDGAAAGAATQTAPFGVAPQQQAPRAQSSGPSRQGRRDAQPPPDPPAPFSIQDTQPHQRPDHGHTGVVVEEEDTEKKGDGDDRDEKDEEMLSVEGVNSVDFARRRVLEPHRAPGRTYAEENPTEGTEDGAAGEEPTALFEEPVDEHLDESPQPIGARTREIQEEEMQKIRMKEAQLEPVKSEVQLEAEERRSGTPIAFLLQKEYDARGAEGNRADGGKDEGSSSSSLELSPGFHDSMEEHWNLSGTEAPPPNNELSSPPDRPEPLQKIDNITRAEKQGKSVKDPPGLGPTGVAFISGAGKTATVCDGRENELATEPKEPVQSSDNGDGMSDYLAEASHATISGTVKATAPKDTKDDASPADAKPTNLTPSKPSSPNKPKARESASKPDHDIKDRPTDARPRTPPPSTPQTTQRRHTTPERTAEENNSHNANKDTDQKPSTEKDVGGVDSTTVLCVAGMLGVTCLAIYKMIK